MLYWKNTDLANLTSKIDGITYYEEWKDIQEFEGYYMVSSFGRIKSIPRYVVAKAGKMRLMKERILCQNIVGKGYLCVGLSKENKVYPRYVHILVGVSFVDNPNNYPEINHIKGIKKDNRSLRLEWVTHSENGKHAYRIKLREAKKGSSNFFSILKESEVLQIRELHETNEYTQKQIGDKFGVDYRTVSYIVNKKTWKHI